MSLEQQQMRSRQQGGLFLLVSLLLIGSNLRAPLTAVGPLIPSIREHLEMSHTVVGSITTLPLIAFALVSPFAPKLANKFGMERMIFISMLLLAGGIALRSVTGVAPLFIGTAIVGIAISFGNVLIPGFIKMSFPFRIGITTGFYVVFMNVFGALASGISVPLSNIGSFGWQGALAAWATLAILAAVLWFPHIRKKERLATFAEDTNRKKTNMWKSVTAWQVTVFMGLQSLMFYTVLTWLPEILEVNGYSLSESGWMLSIMQFALIPITFVLPIIADKMKNQKLLSVMTGSFFLPGTLGLLSGNTGMVIVSVILFGMACGGGFSLSMMFFTLRTKDAYEASELSGMAQSIGYLLAACGPIIFGAIHDLTNGWEAPLFFLCGIAVVLLISGVLAGRDVVIED